MLWVVGGVLQGYYRGVIGVLLECRKGCYRHLLRGVVDMFGGCML